VRSSNPVLTRLTPETQTQAPGYGSPYQTYPGGGVVTPTEDRMTIDDVVVRTVGLLAITAISGAAVAFLVKDPGTLATFWIGGAIVGLILGLIISFKRIVSAPLIFAYAVVEGAFLGAVSKFYEDLADGIVLQAAIATFGIFFLMAALYKARVIRATPKFARGVIGAMIGVFAIIIVNWVLSLFGVDTHLRDGSGLAIIFSLVIIVIAALTFILDFDLVEQSVAQGAPKQFAWFAAFGILVGLIWVYLEVLRLLSYLRGRD
jgi:uncharacterized YccA/Bax inhibitor family protein